jgi:hypothetical protein
MKINGLDKLQKNLNELATKVKNLNGKHNVPLSELLNDSFISSCSSFSNLDDLFKTSGFKVESQEDFDAIPDDEWDSFISSNTSFNNWQDMLQAAAAEWTKKRIGL